MCLREKGFVLWGHCQNLLDDPRSLCMVLASVIPRYDRGSLTSTVLDFGIGLIIPLPQSLGITPLSKQMFKSTCKNKIAESFLARLQVYHQARKLYFFLHSVRPF